MTEQFDSMGEDNKRRVFYEAELEYWKSECTKLEKEMQNQRYQN